MRSPWGEFDRSRLSEVCDHGQHESCGHLDGSGGGFNPRRLRLEFGVLLCSCTCHSPCPVTGRRMAILRPEWQESWSCPGGERERDRSREFTSSRGTADQRRRSSQLSVPSEEILTAHVEAIRDNHGPAVRAVGRSLASAGEKIAKDAKTPHGRHARPE
jgi:hypothetical protein